MTLTAYVHPAFVGPLIIVFLFVVIKSIIELIP